MQIKIDPVKLNEVDQLAFISSKCFYDTFHGQNSQENMQLFLEQSFNHATMQQELLQKENHFFFARTEEEISGYIKLSVGKPPVGVNDSSALEIGRIYVLENKIGLGIGKKLLEVAIVFARNNKQQTIWLGVWENNLRAINFYKKYGFKKFGEHIFMVGNDSQIDWLMKKDITH